LPDGEKPYGWLPTPYPKKFAGWGIMRKRHEPKLNTRALKDQA
jgi:hypothetical protein